MRNLLEFETEFLNQSGVRNFVNLSQMDALTSEMTDRRKSQFETSLKYAKLVGKATDWFNSSEAKELMEDEGIAWSKEDFYSKVIGVSKAHYYRMLQVYKIQSENPQMITQYKRECTQAERNGQTTERSVADLIKKSRGENDSNETSTPSAKTLFTISVKKGGFNGDSGFSMRVDENGQVIQNGELIHTEIQGLINHLGNEIQRLIQNQNQ